MLMKCFIRFTDKRNEYSKKKRKFELVSPEQQPDVQVKVDWSQCFICQS